MKYIVEVTTSNPSHEHISLRRVQKKTSFVVEANNENEALMRARGKFRSLGHYVHNVQLVEQQVNEKLKLFGRDEKGFYLGKQRGRDQLFGRDEQGIYLGNKRGKDDAPPAEPPPEPTDYTDNYVEPAGEPVVTDDKKDQTKGPSEADKKRYGDVGAQIRNLDPEAYKNRKISNDPNDNINLLKRLQAKANANKTQTQPDKEDKNKGPSEADILRYGKVGAQIRNIDPVAYKNRKKSNDPNDNINLLKRLKAAQLDKNKAAELDDAARRAQYAALDAEDAALAAARQQAGNGGVQDNTGAQPSQVSYREKGPTTGSLFSRRRNISADDFRKNMARGDYDDIRFTVKNSDGSIKRVVKRGDQDYDSFVAKYVKEQMEQQEYIEEKLTSEDPASKWISDFVASDNPKFEGKSKKERIRMALGAKYAAMRNEEVEQIDERVSLGAPVSDQLKAKEKVAKSMEDKPDTAVARIDKSIENTKDKDPEYSKRVSAFKDEYLKKKKAADAGETTLVAKEEVEGKLAVTPKEKALAAHHGDPKRITFGDVLKARLKSAGKKVEEQANQDRPVPNPNATPKPPKEPKEPGTTDYTKELELDPSFPRMHHLELERPKVEAEVKKRQAELAKQAAEKAKMKKEEVEQIDEADTSDANYDMINRDALPVPPHRNIRGTQDRINADKRKDRDAAAQEKEKAKDKINIALDRVKAKSKLNKINTKPEMDADVKGK